MSKNVKQYLVSCPTLVSRYVSFNILFEKTFTVKPDFHSRFSLVASEIFRMGHARSVEMNRTGRKVSFALFAFEVQIFQLLRNFLTAKPIRLLS